jgi:hypothetical protein
MPHPTFLRYIFNITIQSTPRSSKFSLSLRFPHQNPICTSPFPIRATCTSRLMFVIADSQSKFNTLHSVGTSPICLQTKFHVIISIASLVMANKLKTNFPRRSLRYITCIKMLPRQRPHALPRSNRAQHFSTPIHVAVKSLQSNNFLIQP